MIPFELIAVVGLVLVGLVFGRIAENRHYRSIRLREDEFRDLIVLAERVIPHEFQRYQCQLVTGNVVISVDYFKALLATLRNLVGGSVVAYESLLDRARREALLRMQADARALGATAVLNLKFDTSRISGSAGQNVGSVEVLAYGTAMIPPR